MVTCFENVTRRRDSHQCLLWDDRIYSLEDVDVDRSGRDRLCISLHNMHNLLSHHGVFLA